jgi:Transposase/Transposase IS116/IS110/IS902 family
VGRLHALLGEHADAPAEVIVGIETDRGLLVGALLAAGYQVYAVNPLAASRYRERHTTSRAKSDRGDAKVLADLVRTDRHLHRRHVAGDSPQAEAVKVLARAHQTLIWTRQRQTSQLRGALREFYPGALTAFGAELANPQALHRRAAELQQALTSPQLAAPAPVTAAYGQVVAATVGILAELNQQITTLEQELTKAFETHPDAEILRSLPGLGVVLGARVLAEFGDDPTCYRHPRARNAYAGTAPITRASGTRLVVLARVARNKRLADACCLWAFSALSRSPGARAYYDRLRAKGASHQQALRALGNRLVGLLHGCVRHRTSYDEQRAWSHRTPMSAA